MLLISLFTGISLNKIDSKVYYTKDKSLECHQIPSDLFKESSYINSYSNDGYLWLEPDFQLNDENQIMCFNLESFYRGDLFVSDGSGTWKHAGSTGTGIKSKEKSLASWMQAFSLNHLPVSAENPDNIKFRIRIESNHSSLIQVYSTSYYDFFMLSSKLSQLLFTIIAIIITVFLLILICSINFHDYDAIFMAVMCLLLCLDILLTTSVGNFTLQTNLTINRAIYKLRYFYLCGAVLCTTATLIKIYRPVLQNNETWINLTTNIFPILSIFVGAVGVFYLCINVDDFTGFIFISAGMLTSLLMAISSILFAGKKNPAAYRWIHYIWIFCFALIFTELIFRQVRFVPGVSIVARVFDNDFGFADTISFTLISVTTLYRMFSRIRTKFAKIQILAENSTDHIKNEKKKSFVYSQLSTMLANPMQIFKDRLEDLSSFVPHSDYLTLSESLNYSEEIIRTLYMLSSYESNPSSFSQEMESIDLHALIHEANSQDVENLKNRGCYPDYQEKFNNGTCVSGNKLLLSVMFRFILRSINNVVEPHSTVLITSEYTNYTLSYAVKFDSKPVSSFEKKVILNLENFADENNSFQTQQSEEIIKQWGIYLHVAKRISSLFNGKIRIVPDVSSNTIMAHVSLEPLPYNNSLDFSQSDDIQEDEMDVPYIENPNPSAPTIFILEENPSVRLSLVKKFKDEFNVYSYASSLDFVQKIDTTKPSAILCSITIPGKNAFELLNEFSTLSVIPFFATAKAASKKTLQQLYKLGAIDVFQKPFNIETVFFKIKSFISNRQRFTNHIIANFGKTVEMSIYNNQYLSSEAKESLTASIAPVKAALEKQISEVKESSPARKINHSTMMAIFTSANLTKKESSIAALIAEGKSDKEIAAELQISPGTVAVHNKNIYKKLDVHSRSQLIEKVQ